MPPAADPHQANDFPADEFSRYVPRQPRNHALQNAWAPPAPANGQPEGHREDIPPQIRGIAGPDRAQVPHHVDGAYQRIIDYQPQLFANPAYVFPDVGHVQGVPGAPVNQEHDFIGFPQHVAPGPLQAAFPQPFIHQIPTPNRPRAENLRRLAGRYLDDPSAHVCKVCTEETAGGLKVVIILETPNVP